MNELDVYYRALLDFCRATSAVRSCSALTSAIAQADAETDKIVVTRAECTVDDDWVIAIEEGLVHIEKAIKEERQFIQSNGETVPIEKVKNVSRESVQHLAKHGNLITRVPEEGEDIVPDKLYTVERLNDYTVYENRFLYMLLCYLRDFVTIRYNKILDLTNKYEGTLDVSKKISVSKRTMEYTVSLKEERRDDKYLRENNSARDIIDRIDLILKTILAFLATPLMEAASKVAMLKPPITKTNVLKMDNNFKGAVRLYDFIIAYDKPGYTAIKKENRLSPFREDLAEELAQAGAIISFLTYEYGLGIKAELKERYNEEEKRRKLEELKKKTEQLEAIGRKLKNSGMTVEEYILSLEKHLRAVGSELGKMESMRAEIELLRNVEREQNNRITELLAEVKALRDELIEQQRLHEEEIYNLKDAHERELEDLRAAHRSEIDALNEAHRLAMEEQKASYEARLEEQKTSYEAQLEAQKQSFEKKIAAVESEKTSAIEAARAAKDAAVKAMQERVSVAEEATRVAKTELADKIAERNDIYNKLLLSDATVKAMRAERGINNGDFSDKESFDRLEEEYKAFTRFYNDSWTKAKKKIRKDVLNLRSIMENLKGKNDDDNRS